MNLAEFQNAVDVRGSDLDAWPDELRLAAERLLAVEPAAWTCLRRARWVDDLIARGMPSPGVDAAAARVLASLRELPRQRRFAWPWPRALLEVDFAPSRWRIAGLAAVACLGVVLGLFGPDIDASDAGFLFPVSPEPSLAAMFEAEPLTGVRP